ncbi:MAG: hypothetical protein KQJ78_25130 [Deltaproteobacteria bacterium]|nr:hypothetical protein [Deltaproteobacteria bacterium]
MPSLTPRQRVAALFNREPLDVMPFFSGLSMVVQPALDELGWSFASLHTDPERMARAAVDSALRMGFDAVTLPFDLGILPEALGCTVNFYENADQVLFPTVSGRVWQTLDEVSLPADLLTRGRIPLVTQAVARARELAPDLPVGVWLRGPFTNLGQVLELEMVLKASFKEKAKVEAALDTLTEAVAAVGSHWAAAGADYLTLSEPGASADVLPPRLAKALTLPRLAHIIAAWPDLPVVLHMPGKSDALVEALAGLGARALAVDHKNDLAATRDKLGPDQLVFGNFDVFALPAKPETTPAAAAQAITEIVAAGVDAVWPGSDLWPVVKEENLRAMIAAARQAGAGPSPAVGRW